MIKDYSELTSRIYTQLSPELSKEFHNMLTEMAKEISRLYEIENAKPSEALKCIDVLKEDGCITTLYQGKALETIRQALIELEQLRERDRFNSIGKSSQYCKNEVINNE